MPATKQCTNGDWQTTAENKRKENHEKIFPEWRLSDSVLSDGKNRRQLKGEFFDALLDKETLQITNLEVHSLLEAIRSRALSSRQVVSAFCKRAAYAHQLNNNILEILFDIALARADDLDRYLEEHGEPIGPLHGLPVTLKDQFHVKGAETPMAWVGWIGTFEGKRGTGKERVTESELIKELWSLGAVPIAKVDLSHR
jgi:amidase